MALSELDQARVRRAISKTLGGVHHSSLLTPNMRICDLGGDSLATVEITLELEDEFHLLLEIPEYDQPTVQDYINLVAQAKRQ